MDNKTRVQYLEAMGIDVWVSRNQSVVESQDIQIVLEHPIDDQKQTTTKHSSNEWSILEQQVQECEKCSLSSTRTQTVFGSGNINADWLLIGEAPGQQEDLEGKPFVGNAGKLLSEMIRAIGLDREQVYICNILKCRPPNNRDPKREEVTSCNEYLHRQITLIKPKVILAVGRIAAQTLLKSTEPLSKLRGVPHQFGGIPLVVVYHPAYLLRSLLEKRKAWQDLQLAIKVYQEKN